MSKFSGVTHAVAVGGLAIMLMATSAAQPALAVNKETVVREALAVHPLWWASAWSYVGVGNPVGYFITGNMSSVFGYSLPSSQATVHVPTAFDH